MPEINGGQRPRYAELFGNLAGILLFDRDRPEYGKPLLVPEQGEQPRQFGESAERQCQQVLIIFYTYQSYHTKPRTRKENDREKYAALKVLRGGSPADRAKAALRAADTWNR